MSSRVARKPKDAYQHGNLREALIQAGLNLLKEGGVEALSLRAAAQLAGVSHAAPYRHFTDKKALVAAIAEEGFRLLTARMRERLDRSGSSDPRQQLRALGAGYLAFATDHPAHLEVIFGGVLCQDGVPDSLRAAGNEAYGTLRGVVADGIAGGEFRPGSVDEVTLAAWSMVHGLSMLLNNGAVVPPAGPAAREPLALAILDRLAMGIATTPADGGRRTRPPRGPRAAAHSGKR